MILRKRYVKVPKTGGKILSKFRILVFLFCFFLRQIFVLLQTFFLSSTPSQLSFFGHKNRFLSFPQAKSAFFSSSFFLPLQEIQPIKQKDKCRNSSKDKNDRIFSNFDLFFYSDTARDSVKKLYFRAIDLRLNYTLGPFRRCIYGPFACQNIILWGRLEEQLSVWFFLGCIYGLFVCQNIILWGRLEVYYMYTICIFGPFVWQNIILWGRLEGLVYVYYLYIGAVCMTKHYTLGPFRRRQLST